jgi:hypothetical protein
VCYCLRAFTFPKLDLEQMLARREQDNENRLLSALSPEARDRLLPQLENVKFSLGQVIYESGGRIKHVYFPTTSHISLLYTMIDGSTAEMGLVGNEGVVGIALFMGGETTPNRAMVQGAGAALRLKRKECSTSSREAANSNT